MSIETFIRAMPKVDLHVQLEGAAQKDFLLLIAEQTDIASSYRKRKEYEEWERLLQEPDYDRLDEIARETAAWLRHPEDLAHMVYDLGVQFSKQNVKYAEISVMPALYTDLGLTFQEFLAAINDGADRALRAWKVHMKWFMSMARERPRKSDDIARWATSAAALKGNVIGLSLVGREDSQPIGQFKKAFATVEKKDLARVTHLFSYPDADSFDGVMETVKPTRITDAWGLIEHEEAMQTLIEQDIPVVVAPIREVRLGRIESVAEYPLRQLLDRGVNLIIASEMPALYNKTLSDALVDVLQEADVTVDELEAMQLNALHASLLPQEEKLDLLNDFQQQFATLRAEHMNPETSEPSE